MLVLTKSHWKSIAVVTITFVSLAAIMLGLQFGWDAAWLGAAVALPGSLLSGAIYAVLRPALQKASNKANGG